MSKGSVTVFPNDAVDKLCAAESAGSFASCREIAGALWPTERTIRESVLANTRGTELSRKWLLYEHTHTRTKHIIDKGRRPAARSGDEFKLFTAGITVCMQSLTNILRIRS